VIKQAKIFYNQTQNLPRIYLYALLSLYIFYGFFNRDPWKNEDVIGFSKILMLAKRNIYSYANYSNDVAGGLYYIYSATVTKLFIFLNVRLVHSVRIGSLILVILILYAIWKSLFKLMHHPTFIPYKYPLGGESSIKNYAISMADNGTLLFTSCVGIILPMHETSFYVFNLAIISYICLISVYVYVYASCPYKPIFSMLYGGLLGFLICLFALLYFNNYDYMIMDASDKFNFSLRFMFARLHSIVALYPTFTWPILPLAIAGFCCWSFNRFVQFLLMVCLISYVCFLCSVQFKQNHFLYTLPFMLILSTLLFAKLKPNMSKVIVQFNVLVYFVLICGLWGVWFFWQLSNINFVSYLSYVNKDYDLRSIFFAALATLVWLCSLFYIKKIAKTPAIWLAPFSMSSGLIFSWVIIIHLWMPAVNQVKTYRYVFNTIDLYVKNDCVILDGLKEPQIASVYYMAKFKVGKPNDKCAFILNYMPYINDATVDLGVYKSNYNLIWQGRRILDKDERFSLFKINSP
jgi:hypothetical protein